MADLDIRRGERTLLVGIQGQGKSNLLAWLVEELPSIVLFDAKHVREEWRTWGPRNGFIVTADPRQISRHPKVIFLVDQLAIEDREGWAKPGRTGYSWTEALRRTFERGETHVVFDEALQLLPANGAHPQARRLILQGRGAGLSMWYGVQRPINVDRMALKTAEHVFCFAVFNAEDLGILRKERGADPAPLEALRDGKQTGHFEFSYHRLGAREWSAPLEVEQVLGVKKGVVAAPAGDQEAVENTV